MILYITTAVMAAIAVACLTTVITKIDTANSMRLRGSGYTYADYEEYMKKNLSTMLSCVVVLGISGAFLLFGVIAIFWRLLS